MEAYCRVRLHQNGASQTYHRDYFARWSWRMCSWLNRMCTLGSRGYFFLIDTDGSWRSRVNEARSAEEKELLISTVSTVYFIPGILRTDLWSQDTKCVICKKKKKQKKTVTWSPQKRSRPALTYHELLSNFIFPLDLDNGARICSACRIALTSSKYKHSAETFVDVSKHDVNNYRPMSVLTPVSKIIGRTIQVQFLAFFNRTRLPVSLTDSGFRTKTHSTETAVVYLTDYILEHMERQMITGVVFIGLKKAFDLVYHECLLFNLEHYGIRGGSLDWFRNYLTTRTQTVQFANDRISTRFNFGVSAFCFVH